MKRIFAIVLTLVLVAQNTASWAESGESTLTQIGSGVGSGWDRRSTSPSRRPSASWGIGSGFTLIFAGPQTANGEESVKFVGDTPAPAKKAATGQ